MTNRKSTNHLWPPVRRWFAKCIFGHVVPTLKYQATEGWRLCAARGTVGFSNRSLEWPLCTCWHGSNFTTLLRGWLRYRRITATHQDVRLLDNVAPARVISSDPLPRHLKSSPVCPSRLIVLLDVLARLESCRRLSTSCRTIHSHHGRPLHAWRVGARWTGRGGDSCHLSAPSCRRPERFELYERFAVKGFLWPPVDSHCATVHLGG